MLQPLSIDQYDFREYYNEFRNSVDKTFDDDDDDDDIPRVNFPGNVVRPIDSMPSLQTLRTTFSYEDGDTIYESRSDVDIQEWDVFRDRPLDDSDHGNEKFYNRAVKTMKLISYVVVFVVVLVGAVISHGILLFMSSQIKVDKKTPYCQLPNANPDKRYEAVTNPQEQAQWMWALFFTYITPEVFTLGRSYRITLFKTIRKSKTADLLIVCIFEGLHTIGIALMLFAALPELDVIKGAMLSNCMCFVPAVLSLLTRTRNEDRFFLSATMDILAILAQATGFFIWPILMREKLTHATWAIPLGLFLTSFGWWENYVDSKSVVPFVKKLAELKDRINKTRYYVYGFVPWFKIFIFFSCMVALSYMHNSDKKGWDMFPIFEYFITRGQRSIEVDTVNFTSRFLADTHLDGYFKTFPVGAQSGVQLVNVAPKAALLTWTIQLLCTWACYVTAKFACRTCIQGFSYAFPINLTIPVTVTMLIAFCGVKQSDVCFMKDMMPRYLFWTCPSNSTQNIFTDENATWIWIVWLLAQTWITLHIWLPKCERLAPTEKLFVTPMYNNGFIVPSLAMNRRKFENEDIASKLLDADIPNYAEVPQQTYYESIPSPMHKPAAKPVDQITHIIACATMWHETDEEMTSMFKSIMRMDEDQCARRNAQKYLQIVDPDYYEFETQIFFDDAFEICDDDWDENVVNRFVKSAVRLVEVAAKEVHKCDVFIKPPQKIPTPYGGRLVWTLPGNTQMVVHLKDKSKIRHRKRWSQVMYMYYLLGFRIMATPYDANHKSNLASNTFILALDGDIDFKPSAVQLLVDLMKKNKDLGASCGRIHPIGSGMMVWYQKFEYAIGHWLQKATEHMIGCVLCSPGCFSLFRARALMDDNVMKKYTLKPTEARHYVQYDQGEDRWLCTLMLQRGYRVEYSAASDAYTHAPEGFGEFYNQRRRWVPSTMANILDLLQDAGKTVKVNDNISTPYIVYQGGLMVGTILGPGTIFLMMVGAFLAAFKVSQSTAFYLNAIPILIFIIMCFSAKPDNQVLCAQILTCIYTLVMLAVMVGILIQISSSGWGSPTTFLTLLLPVTMIIAALLHPLEITCLFWGWLYWLIIPSMYLLLMIYSYMNMNNVSWGTREVQTKKTKEELEAEKKKMEEAKKSQQSMILSFFGKKDAKDMKGGFAISCANLCSFLLCTYPKPKDEQLQLMAIQNALDKIVSRLELIEKSVDSVNPVLRRRSTIRRSFQGLRDPLGLLMEEDEEDGNINDNEQRTESELPEPKQFRDPLINPLWIEDKDLTGPMTHLPKNETAFFKELIDTYLYPIDADKVEQARIMVELKELRNKVVFAFFMLNAIFIVVVLLLQLHKDTLYINWPLGASSNITWVDDTKTIEIAPIYQHMQPIGLVFMIFFAVIIIIQFIGMMFHRFETLSHILASTTIELFSQKPNELSPEEFIQANGVRIAKELQKARGFRHNSGPKPSSIDRSVARRQTIHDIERSKHKKKERVSLDKIFRERLFSIDPNHKAGAPILNNMRRLSMRRETMQLLVNRRRSTIAGTSGGTGTRTSLQSSSHYQEGQRRPSTLYGLDIGTSLQLTRDGSIRKSFLSETGA